MKKAKYSLYIMMLLLCSCGFHLKGNGSNERTLPYSVWKIENAGTSTDTLRGELSRQNVRVTDEHTPEAATLAILKEEQLREVQNTTRIGAVNEYLLVLRVSAQAQYQGHNLGTPMTVTVQRNFSYSDNELLGKQQEEADLWQDMYRDAAGQIVRRMSFLPKADETK